MSSVQMIKDGINFRQDIIERSNMISISDYKLFLLPLFSDIEKMKQAHDDEVKILNDQIKFMQEQLQNAQKMNTPTQK